MRKLRLQRLNRRRGVETYLQKNKKSDSCVLRYGRGKASFEKRKTHKKWQMRQLQ